MQNVLAFLFGEGGGVICPHSSAKRMLPLSSTMTMVS